VLALSVPLARPLPMLTDMNRYFWCGGADGRLHILRCGACGTWSHPYVARCPACRAKAMSPQPTSGRAVVSGFTVNHQPWFPHVPVPYVIAFVQLAEQSEVQLAANIVNCAPEAVRVGMPVKVLFEQYGEIFLPLFEPAEAAA